MPFGRRKKKEKSADTAEQEEEEEEEAVPGPEEAEGSEDLIVQTPDGDVTSNGDVMTNGGIESPLADEELTGVEVRRGGAIRGRGQSSRPFLIWVFGVGQFGSFHFSLRSIFFGDVIAS